MLVMQCLSCCACKIVHMDGIYTVIYACALLWPKKVFCADFQQYFLSASRSAISPSCFWTAKITETHDNASHVGMGAKMAAPISVITVVGRW